MSSSSSTDRLEGARRVLLISLPRPATKPVNFAVLEIGKAKDTQLLRRWIDRRKVRSSPSPGLCIGSRHEATKATTWVRCATRDGGPRKRTREYVEEADRVERRQDG